MSEPLTPSPEGANDAPVSGRTFLLGVLLLTLSAGASLVLVVQHMGQIALPGCGLGGACDAAAASIWGKLPGLNWPTSHVGLTYFLALLAAWFVSGGGLPPLLRLVVRIGALLSLVLTGAMVVGGYLCPYCLAIHGANLTFAVLVELQGRARARGAAPTGSFAGTLALATIVLALLQGQQTAAMEAEAEAELARSVEEITESAESSQGTDSTGAQLFTGRYLSGPEAAPIRLVVFSDYQCPDCRKIEEEIRDILANRPEVSFSAKHFPFNSSCNRMARENDRNLHPNACWAARAAEAAGILGGDEGFYRMHSWLFDNRGNFTQENLPASLTGLGFDPVEFIRLMQDDQTLANVEADVEEAISLGIFRTPMIFINGVELKGWESRHALTRAVEQLAAQDLPALTASSDRPLGALESYVEEWRRQTIRPMPPDTVVWAIGELEDPVVDVVVWGDYQEAYTKKLDTKLRAAIETTPGVRYHFRHFPLHYVCNPHVDRRTRPNSCLASRAAEAAGRLGGNDVYWMMHAWLMDNQDNFNHIEMRKAANSFGIDPNEHREMMQSDIIDAEIRQDCEQAKQLGIDGVPFCFINGKRVVRWNLEGEPVLESIIQAAREDRTSKSGSR